MTQFITKRLNLETHDEHGNPRPVFENKATAPTLEEIANFQENAVLYPAEQGVPALDLREIKQNAQKVLVQGVPMKEALGISDTQVVPCSYNETTVPPFSPVSPQTYLPPYLHRRDRFAQLTSNGLTFLGNRARAELGEQPIDVYVGQGYYSAQELYEIANLAQKLAAVLYPGVKSSKLSGVKGKAKKKKSKKKLGAKDD